MLRLASAYNMTIEEYKTCYDYVDYLEIFPEPEEDAQVNPSKTNDTQKPYRS